MLSHYLTIMEFLILLAIALGAWIFYYNKKHGADEAKKHKQSIEEAAERREKARIEQENVRKIKESIEQKRRQEEADRNNEYRYTHTSDEAYQRAKQRALYEPTPTYIAKNERTPIGNVEVFVDKLQNSQPTGLKRSDGSALEYEKSQMFPTKNGLFPHEIVLLNNARYYSYDQKHYQNYLYYKYQINDAQKALHSLLDRGFLCLGDMRYQLGFLTVNQLKHLLKSKNLKISGKKADLIDRLLLSSEESELKAIPDIKQARYKITDMGLSEIKENEYVMFIHRHGFVDLIEANRRIHEDKRPFMDVIHDILKGHSENAFVGLEDGYWIKRYAKFCSEFAKDRDYFVEMCWVIFDSMNQIQARTVHRNRAYDLLSALRNYFPYDRYSMGSIPPYALSIAGSYVETTGISMEELKEKTVLEFNKLSHPNDIFTASEAADALIYNLTNNEPSLVRLYEKVEKRLRIELEQYPMEVRQIKAMFHDKYED